MTTLGIRYLTNHAVAANLASPRTPEFPPHFGRVFMAMAATYFETRGAPEERQALEWLETAGPPSIRASRWYRRSFVETYVPVNDKLAPISTLRSRQPRAFPTARLDDPYVYLVWNSTVPQVLEKGLRQLCEKVTRLGHSSSLVQMWVPEEPADMPLKWQPDEDGGNIRMRTVEQGTLAYLERSFNANAIEEHGRLAEAMEAASGKRKANLKKEIGARFPNGAPQSTRPLLTRWQSYRKTGNEPEAERIWPGPFDPRLIVLTRSDVDQPVMAIESTVQLASTLRDAAMKSAGPDVPEWLSGHQPDGKPSLRPHAAFLALPFVGARYADGHVMGLAIAIPRNTAAAEARSVIGSLLFSEDGEEKAVQLYRERWHWELQRERRDYPGVTLSANTWIGPADQWASVTPVVLHHYPKRNRDGDVERILTEAFESAGFPCPAHLRAQPVSWFEGAAPAKAMPVFTDGGPDLCRYQTHIVVRFAMKVEGPVLIGRGRFRGYGLLRPIREAKRA